MRNFITFLTLLIVVCLTLAARSVVAGTRSECGSFKVAFYEHGALYYKNKNGDYTGIDKDIIDELARRTGCRFETSLESRVRIWSQMENNVLDISVSAIEIPEREKYAYFVNYITARNYALLQNDVPVRAQTMAGFLADHSLTVAVVKSFRHGAVFDSWLDKLRLENRVYEVADFRSLFRVFKAHRVDAIVALPLSWGQLMVKEEFLENARIFDWASNDKFDAGLVISKKRVDKKIVELLQQAMQEMNEDGTTEAIFKRHISSSIAHELVLDKYKH